MAFRGTSAIITLALFGLLSTGPAVLAQDAELQELAFQDSGCEGDDCAKGDKDSGDKGGKEGDKPKPKIKPLSEFVKDKERIAGLFPIYRDKEAGTLFLELNPAQIGPEFIYHNYVQSGVSGLLGLLADLGVAGQIQENYVVSFRRRFNQIDVVRQSTDYVIDESSPLARAASINNRGSVMATMNVVASDKDSGRIVVAANGLFAGTDLLRLGSNSSPLLSMLGFNPSLSKSKTSIVEVANFPSNSAVLVEYVFDFKKGPRPASVLLQHNFTPLPASDYRPRDEDARVGFFTVQKTNLGVVEGIAHEDKIRRWKLTKKDPAAAVSPVEKPITFWIQNSTPTEYRETIRQAALAWNEPFEAAGFQNAIEVKIQPDDADWKPGDARYNVIQWIASPSPIFNGYGPSVINPRTGEILAANIILEQKSVSRQLLLDKLFPGAESVEAMAAESHGEWHGDFQHQMRLSLDFASTMLKAGVVAAGSADEDQLKKLVQDSLRYLVMHEVGHTLGLTHNMKGSFYRSIAELKGGLDPAESITGSVMDYPATNILPGSSPDIAAYPDKLGPYDRWAIGYGYDDRMDEPAHRDAHLARAGTPGYLYGNDAEDMRSTGRGMDPRVIPYDMSSDPLAFATGQIELIRSALKKMPERFSQKGLSNSELLEAHELMMTMYRQHALAMSRFVGGIYVDRDIAPLGKGEVAPLRPVDAAEQRRAMAALGEYVLAPDAFGFDPAYLSLLIEQRRGMSGVRAPNVIDEAWKAQSPAIDHLLHPATLERLLIAPDLGGNYRLSDMMIDLFDHVYAADMRGSVNSYRRNLQAKVTDKLIETYGSPNTRIDLAKPQIYALLRRVERQMKGAASRGDAATQASRRHIVQRIQVALKDKG